jgi:hypothetical protein
VAKVQHKPIKSPRKGSNKKSKIQPKAALVWRTGLSGAPGRSTPNLPPSGFWDCLSAIIHRTVRCSTELSGVPSGATANCANGRLQKLQEQWTVRDCARRVRAGARRRTGQWTVIVRCTTWLSGGSTCQSSNDRTLTVGWRGWRTGQCLVRPSTTAFPYVHFGGWGYKYPPTTTHQGIQVFSQHIQYKS